MKVNTIVSRDFTIKSICEVFSYSVCRNVKWDFKLGYSDIDFDFSYLQYLHNHYPRLTVSTWYKFRCDFFGAVCVDLYYGYVAPLFQLYSGQELKDHLLVRFESGSMFFDTLYDRVETLYDNISLLDS